MIGIILPDPDPGPHLGPVDPEPDPYLPCIPTNCKATLYTFSRKFWNVVKNVKNYNTYEADEKDKTI